MKLWSLLYPSIAGGVLIVKALVISLAYYLMTVNGISCTTLTAMEKSICSFIWSGRRGQMAWERAILPISKGGIGAPSVKLRYEAIKVGWLKRWWRPEPDRPKWAWVANDLMFQCARQQPKFERTTLSKWIGQSWQIKNRSELLPTSLKEMAKAAQKYNASISGMRASTDQRLELPAFFHPYAKNKHVQNNSKVMTCLQVNHDAKTVRDLVRIATTVQENPDKCPLENLNGKNCGEKAMELLSRIERKWNPMLETPQRHDLWHTPNRIKRYREADPLTRVVLYNPDTRSKHCMLGAIRIFSKEQGHKSIAKDPYLKRRSPARINPDTEPSGHQITISTDGSTIRNGWENASAGIGVWYEDGSGRNISMELKNNGTDIASNSRAELGAILEALRQNEEDDLEIESDSLTSLRAICTHAEKYEDQNWSGVRNSDLLKAILINLRTRPARTSFKWVKGHEDNYGNNRADALANEGRESDLVMRFDDEEWTESNAALQDGARLQALEARHIYAAILKWHTKKHTANKHQAIIEEAKDRIEEATGLRPTNEKMLKSSRSLGVSPCLRDHMRCVITGRIKCGAYWSNIPNYEDRATCSACKKNRNIDIIESETHMWQECENNRQDLAWDTAKLIWQKTTTRTWPNVTMGLIRGATALTFEDDSSKDSERLRILISMTVWAIWKSRNKNTILDLEAVPSETRDTLKELIRDLIQKSWNATHFMEGRRKLERQNAIKTLWAHGRFTDFDPKTGPSVDFT